jgi:phosphatidylglycerophosphatase A
VWRTSPFATAIATWFGAGFLPLVPGTWGSVATLPVVELLYRAAGVRTIAALAVAAALAGIPAAGVVAKKRGIGDPSEVVIDEVAGQAISVFPVYLLAPRGRPLLFWAAVLASFFLFRVIDVWKPGPVGKLESLPGGLGIMADDLLGGVIVAVSMAAALFVVVR